MDKSQFASVVFDLVPEFYPIEVNVQCSYTLSKSIQPSEDDWVGLYKVGWTRQSHYLCYQPAGFIFDINEGDGQSATGHNRRGWAVFPANQLPKEDGEFYQFCYVSCQHGISGASTPFQFRKHNTEEFVEIEEGDMMVVRPQIDVLREKILDLEQKKVSLTEERDQLVTRVESLESQAAAHEIVIKNLQQHLHNSRKSERDLVLARDGLAEQLAAAEQNTQKIIKENEAYAAELEAAEGRLGEMREEMGQLESTIETLRAQVKALQSEKDELSGENQSLLDQVNSYKDQVTESQNVAARREKEMEGLNEKLQCATIEYASQKQLLMQEMETESHSYTTALQKKEEKLKELESQNQSLERCCQDLQMEFDNAKDKLRATEEIIAGVAKDLKDSEEAKQSLQLFLEDELPKTRQQLSVVTAELQRVRDEKFALTVRLADFEEGLKETITTKDGEVAARASELEETSRHVHFLQEKLRQAEERIMEGDDISEAFNKRVAKFNQARSSEATYKQCLEEERLQQASANQEMEAAMFALQNANDYLTARLQSRDEELNGLLHEKAKHERHRVVHEQTMEDLNKRLELAKQEYLILLKKHRKITQRLDKEEELRGQCAAAASVSSDEGAEGGRSERGKQKYKQLYRAERQERERCQEELARSQAAVESMETRARDHVHRMSKLTEQNKWLSKSVTTRDKQVESLQKKIRHMLRGVKKSDGGATSPGAAPFGEAMAEEKRAEEDDREEEPERVGLQRRNPFVEEEAEEPQRVELHYKNPFAAGGATAAAAAEETDQNKGAKTEKDPADLGKEFRMLRVGEAAPWSAAPPMPSESLQEDCSSDGSTELSTPLDPEITPGAKVAAVKHLLSRPNAEEPEVYQDCSPFFVDQVDENFADAVGEGMKICPFCEVSVFASIGFEEHVATHFGRICPLCKSQADDAMSERDFEVHVNKCCEQAAAAEDTQGQ